MEQKSLLRLRKRQKESIFLKQKLPLVFSGGNLILAMFFLIIFLKNFFGGNKMKKCIALITSVITIFFSGCSSSPPQNTGNKSQQENQNSNTILRSADSIEPLNVEAKLSLNDLEQLDKTKIGYGQGVQVDEQNRTLGALDFNEKYSKYNAVAISENSDDKFITLTFDQGYENGYTNVILDTLKEKNIKAIFFVLQDYVEKNPELVKRMIDEGHIVGNHSVSHYSMPTLSGEECQQEIMELHDYMLENFNYEMTLFRPPMGEFSEYSLAQTQSVGYKTVLWSYAYADWDVTAQPDYETAYQKLVTAVHPGAIYLLHSVSKTNAEVLPAFIDKMISMGYEFRV